MCWTNYGAHIHWSSEWTDHLFIIHICTWILCLPSIYPFDVLDNIETLGEDLVFMLWAVEKQRFWCCLFLVRLVVSLLGLLLFILLDGLLCPFWLCYINCSKVIILILFYIHVSLFTLPLVAADRLWSSIIALHLHRKLHFYMYIS